VGDKFADGTFSGTHETGQDDVGGVKVRHAATLCNKKAPVCCMNISKNGRPQAICGN
jgi:hypothetical protein